MTTAFPLAWPAGWPRAETRKRAKFSKGTRVGNSWEAWSYLRKGDLSIADGTERIIAELRSLGVRQGAWVISTNLELRNDGLPRSTQRVPADPGVAVYWSRGKEAQKVMAIDLYDRVADNLAAIAATLNAMRAIERHGGAQILERAFTGFDALPAPDAFDPWAVLGLKPLASRETIEAQFRKLAMKLHPDVAGGSTHEFQRLERAKREALKTT